LEFAPKFDETRVKEFSRSGDLLSVKEKITTNALHEVGGWVPLYKWDAEEKQWVKIELDDGGELLRELTAKGVAFPAWVQHVTVSSDKEFLDDEGNVALRAHSRVSDGGSAYILAKGWSRVIDVDPTITPGGETEAQKKESLKNAAYTAFSSQTSESAIDISGGDSPSDDIIASQTYDGVTWYWKNVPGGDSWYDSATGGYAQSGGVCPHYHDGKCNIADIDVIWDYTERECPNRNGRNWSGCPRALAALENQKEEAQDTQFASPVVCHSSIYPAAGTYEPVYFRNVYIRDDMPGTTKEQRDAAAKAIGVKLADNLLAVRSARGWVKTVTIPLDLTRHITGTIMSVSHDYKNKRTTLSYRVDGDVPDFLNSNSPQSMSFYIWERENNRNTKSIYGTVLQIVSKKRVIVQAGDGEIVCASNIISLAVGDNVRVSLPAGNRMDGTIEERV
jgi:hypothetical protein